MNCGIRNYCYFEVILGFDSQNRTGRVEKKSQFVAGLFFFDKRLIINPQRQILFCKFARPFAGEEARRKGLIFKSITSSRLSQSLRKREYKNEFHVRRK